jgi:flagellar protein FlaG
MISSVSTASVDNVATKAAADQLAKVSSALNRRLKFEVDPKYHDVSVKVIDGNTDKVIKEIPPEQIQKLRDAIMDTIGKLFDERV